MTARSGWHRLHCFQPTGGGQQNLGPGWGFHLKNINVAVGNLVSDVPTAGATLIKQQTR